MGMTRRSFVTKVAVGAAAMPLLSKVSFAQARFKLKLGYMKVTDSIPTFMGIEKGFFREEGLELEAVPFVGGAAIAPAMAAGDIQIAITGTVPMNRAKDAGMDFQYLVAGSINLQWLNDTDALQVLMGSPIKAPKDMIGKTLAPNTLYSLNHLFIVAYLRQHGIDPGKVKLVEVGFPAQEAALVAKRIDVTSTHEPFVTMAVKRNVTHVIAHNWSEVVPRFALGYWFASEKWIKANKESARAFIRGFNRALDYLNAHPDEARATLPKWTGLPPDIAQVVALPLWEKRLLKSDLQPIIDLSYEHKFTKRRLSAEEQISDLALTG